MTPFVADFLIPVGKIVAVILYPLVMVVVMIWLERRVVALIQGRLGPNRVGFQGLLQPVADAVKLFFKENIMQRQADKLLFNISPVLVMFSSLLAFCFIPLGEPIRIGSYTLTLWIAESPVGLLIILGLSSISVFGVIFGGWASNSKYPLMGALRSVVQVLSYEIPIGLTVLTVVFIARSMDLVEIVRRQESSGVWYGFLMPVSFVVFWISAVAETNRAPFDLPEAESELVAGYHTEYSGMKFAYFYMAEYAHMVLVSSLVVILFFGGWLPPFPSVKALSFLHVVPGFIWYLIKIMFFLYLYVWIRATFPRYRFDSLIRLVWKWLIPLSLLNFLAVALARYIL
ncbi:MAG: NADH-quinone oxidoreductase subunit NuoH [Candidatus Aminicenantes bacterium]|nr:NADH-quinone oxidoreductase subunit NuoH [Candidatus Aminicenantes bacterium]MCJ7488370.1 NADH-quinone oxidoreductase subunit NuoH [Candidatus Aminicenantes bacterium]TFG55692.1 MAG: NADH-quinone oxidoreductase subunit NuoH [Candidatus Aminicenantes bacterium]